ncbi:MAG: asparagine synthase (glutamine-hydrolyzing) [Alphaproteobacteria bacterium PRO2]|nr:asparagine synthase (glutamine-hydrolyzing) [Alphaproteobacteria bacterium PRO2]
MCGIAGFSGFKGDSAGTIARMIDRIAHRGPDDEGILLAGNTAIGMRRLSIIDIAHGKQPITLDDLSIVFNGEIYNHADLRLELEAKGCVFQTQSDTEVVLQGYKIWGEDCLTRLRGMFAFAIFNQRDESLFIARDRIGIKPLYYAQINGQLIFASEIKSLLQHPDLPRDVNPAAIDEYLSLRYVPGPQTLFSHIKKFPPAHFMVWRKGQGSLKRYWTPGSQPAWNGTRAEAQEAFDHAFDEATRIHMLSERPVGAFLSGGLDSAAIASSLTGQFPQQLKTFAVGFGWEGDELSDAAATAKFLRTDHYEIICGAEDTSLLGKIIWNLDEPIGDGIVLPMYLLSRLASEKVTVVQSGEGADEILGGYFMHRVIKWASVYSRYVPGLIQSGAIMPLIKAVPASLLNQAFDYPGELGEAGKKRLLEFLSILGKNSTAEQYRFLISLFSETDKQSFYTPEFSKQLASHRNEESALLDFNNMLALQFEHWLPDDILCKLDKMTMAHSLEGRVPYMDHKFVELVMSMPPGYKIGPKGNKLLLRNYLAKTRASGTAKRKKKPFYIPINQYLNSEPLKGMVAELLSESAVKKRGLFRWEAIRNLRQAADQPGFLFGKQIFSLAMLELWYRIFIDEEQGWL